MASNSSAQPDAQTLQQTRADLAPLLLTNELVEEAHKKMFSQALAPQFRLI